VRLLLISLLFSNLTQAVAATLYTHRYSDGVQAIQWVETGGQLTGTLQTVQLTTTGRHLSSTAVPFTGVQNGAQLALKFSNSFLGISDNQTVLGTFNAQRVVLNFPQSSGGLDQVAYQPSTVTQYNALVAGVQAEADHLIAQDEQRKAQQAAAAQTRQAQEAAQAAAEARVRQQTQVIRTALDKVQDDLANAKLLMQDVALQTAELRDAGQLFLKDLQEMQRDHDSLNIDAQKAAVSKDCYDMHTVQGYDLNELTGYDLKQLTGYDTNNLTLAVKPTQKMLDDLNVQATNLAAVPQKLHVLSGANPNSTLSVPSTLPVELQRVVTTLAQTKVQLTTALTTAQHQREQAFAQAESLIADARRTAAGLICAPSP